MNVDWMMDDMTFCSNRECPCTHCELHAAHIRCHDIPHSFSMFMGTDECILTKTQPSFLNITVASNSASASFEKLAEALIDNTSPSDLIIARICSDVAMAIHRRREELNLNIGEFAKWMGVSRNMAAKWESGEYNFSIFQVATICEKLGMDLDVILRVTPTAEKGASEK